jgi:hypothetical protein
LNFNFAVKYTRNLSKRDKAFAKLNFITMVNLFEEKANLLENEVEAIGLLGWIVVVAVCVAINHGKILKWSFIS